VKVLLVDNGSLEPAVVLALREMARRLAQRVGRPIFPVSLAHSDKIPAAALGGVAAQCVEAFLREELASADPCESACGDERASGAGKREFVIVPFFIGPSRAVTRALPKLIDTLRGEFPHLRVRIAPVLHAAGDDTLARILADRVHRLLSEIGKAENTPVLSGETETGGRVRVALVDHGSPAREVTAVRDEVAAQLAVLLSGDTRVAEVAACSMERRPGADYAFNEPLLETQLAREQWRDSAGGPPLIIVAQLFLLPGRHAGPSGDIAQICARVAGAAGVDAVLASVRTVQTEPLATHPLIVELLAQRFAAVR